MTARCGHPWSRIACRKSRYRDRLAGTTRNCQEPGPPGKVSYDTVAVRAVFQRALYSKRACHHRGWKPLPQENSASAWKPLPQENSASAWKPVPRGDQAHAEKTPPYRDWTLSSMWERPSTLETSMWERLPAAMVSRGQPRWVYTSYRQYQYGYSWKSLTKPARTGLFRQYSATSANTSSFRIAWSWYCACQT